LVLTRKNSISQDSYGIRVLLFARLHHLNLHYFEVELGAELAALKDKGTMTKEQILRVRRKLKEYCMQTVANSIPLSTKHLSRRCRAKLRISMSKPVETWPKRADSIPFKFAPKVAISCRNERTRRL
jgi:hypothetical protein